MSRAWNARSGPCTGCGLPFTYNKGQRQRAGQHQNVYCSAECLKKGIATVLRERPVADPEVRFWSYVVKGDRCWLWTGAETSQGYGTLSIRGHRRFYAHRFSWVLHHGPIPDGLFVCHSCDVRMCVRPDHLFVGTQADNVADAVSKGRMHLGEAHGNAKLTSPEVVEIRERIRSGERQRLVAERFGTSQSNVSSIALRKHWRHLA